MINYINPAFIIIIGAFLIPLFKGKAKKIYLISIPLVSFIVVWSLNYGTYGIVDFMDMKLITGRVDRLAKAFAYVFTIMLTIGAVYGLHLDDDRQHIAGFLYAGSAVGVTFAGDLFTLLLFWEVMAFASAYLIFAKREERAIKAAYRYLMVHGFGGICLLGGIIVHYNATGSLVFENFASHAGSVGFYMILLGFMINAAVPPLHAWLPDAYPEGTITGSVFLCAFTTKTAVYVLVRGFPGTDLLVPLGVCMALYGVVYAMIENDCRRLLSYHIVSQVGYMVTGVGIGTQLALNGAVAHAFAHIIYKALLFMGMGSVIYMTGKRRQTDLGGLWKSMPITMILYMIGGISISAFPLFSGFVSKSLITSGAHEAHFPTAYLLLTLVSAGTFLSTTLKLPYSVFWGEDKNLKAEDPPINMVIGMAMAAFICFFLGVFPGVLYAILPFDVEYHPYTVDHVFGTMSFQGFTLLGFLLLINKLKNKEKMNLDLDWFYRKGGECFMLFARKPYAAFEEYIGNMYNTWCTYWTIAAANFFKGMDRDVVDGLVNGTASFFMNMGGFFQRRQTGLVRSYAGFVLLGSVVIMVIYLYLII